VFPARTHRLCPKAAGETCHAERFFCTARQRVSRLVRKALSFSKSFDMHELWLRIFLTEHNLNLRTATHG
jgi:IS1 family transposase